MEKKKELVRIADNLSKYKRASTFGGLFLFGYYDFKNSSSVTPFIGAGIGMINAEFEYNGDKSDDTKFGYNVMAGISFAANKNVNFDLSYRLQGITSDFEDVDSKIEYMSSNFFVGMRYNF